MLTHSVEVLVSPIGLLINVLTQIIRFRYSKTTGLLKSVFLGFGVGLLWVITIDSYINFAVCKSAENFVPLLISNLLIYSSLGYCYFHFINLGETARRIRIMRELYDSSKPLQLREILERYNAHEIVQRRVGRLVKSGQLIEKEGRYYIGSSVLFTMAKIIVAMKRLFLGGKSESDWR